MITFLKNIRHKLIGRPLATSQGVNERLSNMQGLAIFGADPLSSTAYGTDEILLALTAAGVSSSVVSVWIAIAIGILILIVSISYRQAIFAYPQGGGVYNVAKENLGTTATLVGAASLLIDYILTAAVSVVAGVAAITSAFPSIYDHRIIIGILVIVFLMWINLRGVRQSGRIFAIPTYVFLFSYAAFIIYGLFRFATHSFPVVATASTGTLDSLGAIGLLLILHTFAAGCTAMTGIEAISNGVKAFKAPEPKNASKTMLYMAFLLGVIFICITLFAHWAKIVPVADQTIVSQIAHALFNDNPFYYLIQIATALILLLAANTPFADFPRLMSLGAKDGYLPHQFYNLGSRLVFSQGIIFLSAMAALLIYVFNGSVHALIPLYAVGVFLGFSLSQLGMIVHWKKVGHHKPNMIINTIGFIATTIVFLIVFFSKFTHGAWLLVPGVILIVLAMKKIRDHYASVEKMMELNKPLLETAQSKAIIILVAAVNRATQHAVQFAKSLNPVRIRAVHVASEPQNLEAFKEKWVKNFPEVELDILPSQYRDLIEPLLIYLSETEKKWPDNALIVVIPQFVPQKFWQHFLYNKTAQRLGKEIEEDPNNHAQILELPIKPDQFK